MIVRSPRRRLAQLSAKSVILALCAGLGVVGMGLTPATAVEAQSDTHGTIDLFVQQGSVVAPEDPLTVRVTVRAAESQPLPNRAIRLSITREPFATETALRRFINREVDPALEPLQVRISPEILELETGDVRIDLAAPVDPNPGDPQPQVWGLQADLISSIEDPDSAALISQRQFLVVVPENSVINPTPVAPIVTLTVPPTGGQALTEEELEAYTVAGGPLDVVAGVLRRHPATVAVDSRITQSIEALGEDAPDSARGWAEDLNGLGLAQFALPWADADPLATLEIDSLLYSRLGQYPWLHDNHVTAQQLELLAQRSAEAVLAPSSLVESDRTVVRFGQTTIIRVDSELSAAVREGIVAPTEVEAEAALQRVQGLVAKRAFSGTREVLVVDTGRLPTTTTSLRLENVLQRLSAVSYVSVVPVPFGQEPNELVLDIGQRPPSQQWKDFVADVAELWDSDVTYAIITSNPEAAIVARWNRYLALFSSTWLDNPVGREAEFERAVAESQRFQQSVWIEQGSSITVLADRTELPVTVRNDLPTDVQVTLSVQPRRGILRVEESNVTVSIPAQSFARVGVPVRSLANGTVEVDLSLGNALGEVIGEPVSVEVTIRAGWEGVISFALASIIGLVFAVGLYRAIQKRLREQKSLESLEES